MTALRHSTSRSKGSICFLVVRLVGEVIVRLPRLIRLGIKLKENGAYGYPFFCVQDQIGRWTLKIVPE